MVRSQRLEHRRKMAVISGLLCTVIVAVVAIAERYWPHQPLLPLLYVVPVPICFRSGSLKLLWSIFALETLVVVIIYALDASGAPIDGPNLILANRLLILVILIFVTFACYLRIIGDRRHCENQSRLQTQADELHLSNEEILRREEEIVRQNEELQSQTEELERQTEELRVTNEELAAREKALEQLLELSRSLTAELTRGQLTTKICESLGLLTDGNASAIIERRATGLEVVCHHGFGPAGLKHMTLPAEDSFSSLIASMGQTGFIEDIRSRPELKIPEPAEGEPFLSVLSTPLRVQGRLLGTIEIYATQPRAWDFTQVSLLESLASQASISIQNMELVESIRQERRRFESAFRTVPFGLAITDDPRGQEVKLNPAASSIFGIPMGENASFNAPGGIRLRRQFKRNRETIEVDDMPLQRALHGEEILGDELEFASTKGALTLLFGAAPIFDGDGKIVGAVSAFADISQSKVLQRELELRRREAEEASVRKTRFLAAVSHDIRTPANAINLMAELIRRSSDNPALAKDLPDLAERLQANTASLMELVSDVLDVARFDSGKVELVESEFALSDLIADECRHVRPLADDKGLELQVEPLERAVWLHTDRVKLGRILGNLLGNAIKFTPRGSIQIKARLLRQGDRQLEISVTDTGIGIPSEHLNQIFDEFAQLHNPERDRSKGTGLGLAICKRLVSVMGGDISVHSRPGQGSTFQILLPSSCVALRLDATFTSSHEVKAPRSNKNPTARLVDLRILLVEDHVSTREGTARLLRQEGAIVQEAETAREALDRLEHVTETVVLLDMMLPDMDGREVLKRLQSRTADRVKGVLVLTGDLTAERLADIRELGADGLIGKPIDVEKLIAALQSYRER